MSYRVAGEVYGPAYAKERLEQYHQHLATAATSDRIVETLNGSPDREVNRYTKPTLMLVEAEEHHGWNAMNDFLRALMNQARTRKGGLITTEDFLTIAEQRLGRERRDEFKERLWAEGW